MSQNEKKGIQLKAYSSKKVVRRSTSCRTGDDGLDAATKSYPPDNLHEYSLYTLLYGTEHGTCHENTTLLLKIQNFLTKCGRFNPQS